MRDGQSQTKLRDEEEKRNTKRLSESEATDRYRKDGMQPLPPLSTDAFFINFWNLGN